MTWSFSRLNSYYTCPYEFYLHYIECNKGINNFFGQFGTLIHTVLEKYAKNELSIFEISQYYEDNFDDVVTERAPFNKYVDIRQSYYEKGLDYLNNIDLLLYEYEILGVEKKVEFTIAGYNMLGYIDLLLRDKEGNIIVLDHKSASLKFKKNGEVSKTDAQHFLDFKRQLYLYSMAVINEYKIQPKYLWWNMFKEQKHIKIEFNQDEYEEAINWAKDTVQLIEKETMWLPNQTSSYYCNYLCGMRNSACEYKAR
jgi:CRISPR/Cas system-associated exonuclease Cas4 (RecB family)